jgi:poly(3-hydroxyalkanoate) depolymerase
MPRNASTATSTRASDRHQEPTSGSGRTPQRPCQSGSTDAPGGDRLGRRTVEVGGHRLAVTQRGYSEPDGPPPLLLINGIGATGELFDSFVDAFENLDGRAVISFDAPGVGLSSTPLYPPTIRQLANTMSQLIDALGYSRVDVLGLSWGGALAQELAYRHPGQVRRLILCATMHGWTSTPGRIAAMSVLMSPIRYYSTDYLYHVAPTLYGGAIRSNRELIREHARVRSSRPPTLLGYGWQMAALRRWTSFPWLPTLTQPTLILAGDDDPIIPLGNAETLAARIPNAELQVVEGGGHLFLYTRPADMAHRIVDFLNRPRKQTGNRAVRTPSSRRGPATKPR